MLGKHRLEPKEETELKVTYKTEGSPGIFRKSVTLSTNIPGHEKIEVFSIKGEVLEAPGAKISVKPRRITVEGNERSTGKKQIISITNDGTLPLEISRIRSKDGKTIYFDGEKEGIFVVEPAQTKTMELRVEADSGAEPKRDFILIDSNAKNAGESGYFLLVQYGAP
jgi:uncharacterized membrane protein